MTTRRLLGDGPASAVTIVEPPLSRWYARRARVVFWVAALGVALTATPVLLLVVSPVAAAVAGVVLAIASGLVAAALVRVWPVLRVLWHWAAELTAFAVLLTFGLVLASVTRPVLAVAVLLVPAGVVAAVPRWRRWVAAWGWCAVVRHRLRLCFAEFIRATTRTRPGVAPLILWAWPTPAGERVWVWLRPGLDLDAVDGKTDRLAVACWAAGVRVVRASARYAALVRVDVSRRDPLTAVVASPLRDWVPSDATVPPTSVPPRLWGLELADVPEELPPDRTARVRVGR